MKKPRSKTFQKSTRRRQLEKLFQTRSKLQFVQVTLEEILTGSTLEVPVKHNFTGHGEETRTFQVPINPGQEVGDQIKLYSEDPQPVEVIFIVKEFEHEHFERHGVDLHYTIHLTPQESAGKIWRHVPLLNQNQPLRLCLHYKPAIINLENQGLPYLEEPSKRGDLVVCLFYDCPETFTSVPTNSVVPKNVALSLEEVLNGCTKTITFQCKTVDVNENMSEENREFQFEIKPIPSDVNDRGTLDIQKNVPLTLEQILTGAAGQFLIERRSYDDSLGLYFEKKKFSINVKPGTETGTRIVLAGEGHQSGSHSLRGNLVFVIQEIPHSHFTRHGHDLHYKALISSVTKMMECTLLVPLLDVQPPEVEVKVKKGDSVKRFARLGLPHVDHPLERGDLIVHVCCEQDAQPMA